MKVWFDNNYNFLQMIDDNLMIGSKDHAPREINLSYYSKEKAELIKLTAKQFNVTLV